VVRRSPDEAFRQANVRLAGVARENGFAGLIPFVCECPDPACLRLVELSVPEFDELCSTGRRAVASDHEARVVGGSARSGRESGPR
jgi:hypothetical protein